jgi:hypothetical protein
MSDCFKEVASFTVFTYSFCLLQIVSHSSFKSFPVYFVRLRTDTQFSQFSRFSCEAVSIMGHNHRVLQRSPLLARRDVNVDVSGKCFGVASLNFRWVAAVTTAKLTVAQ